jgi:uncharacterized protein (TIGR03000 family)
LLSANPFGGYPPQIRFKKRCTMSKTLFSALLGAVAFLGLPSISSAQHGYGGHGGHSVGHVGGSVGHISGWHEHGGWHDHAFHGGWYGGYHRGYWPYHGFSYCPFYYGYSRPYYYSYTEPYYYSYAQPYDYSYAPTYVTPSYNDFPMIEEQETVSPADTAQPAYVEVQVPAAAQLWFEGVRMNQTGTIRDFVSPALQPGRTFTYDIRAQWTPVDRPGWARRRPNTPGEGTCRSAGHRGFHPRLSAAKTCAKASCTYWLGFG